jgi:hypothetical protein
MSEFLRGHTTTLAKARAALSLGHPISLVGIKGSGTTSTLRALLRDIPDAKIIHLTEPVTLETVIGWFREQTATVCGLDGLEWLVALDPDGLQKLRAFADGAIADRKNRTWIVSSNHSTWQRACQLSNIVEAFPTMVFMEPMPLKEMQQALLSRHAMSGFSLAFENSDDIGWQLQQLLNREEHSHQRIQNAWFRTLHTASGGIIGDALALWLSSISRIDIENNTIWMKAVPRPPTRRLSTLPAETLIILRAISQQGSMNAQQFSDMFLHDLNSSQAKLTQLSNIGLLFESDGNYRLPAHLHALLVRLFIERDWIST